MIKQEPEFPVCRPRTSRKKKQSLTKSLPLSQDHFFISNGLRKRRIYYDVRYTEEERDLIRLIKETLKRQKNIDIDTKQVLLRYYYSSDLKMPTCIKNLTAHHDWFSNPQIQILTNQGKDLLKTGYVYSYDFSLDGKPFAVMQLGDVNLEKYPLNSYMQCLNYVNNMMIKDKLIPGHIQTYDYILDLNQKFLSLPIGTLRDIVKNIMQAYAMMLGKLFIVNCTTFAKFICKGVFKILSEQTSRKVKIYTSEDVSNGALKQFIDESVLQVKYGGTRPNIDFQQFYSNFDRVQLDISQQTEYFSIDEDNPMFTAEATDYCCSAKQCQIY